MGEVRVCHFGPGEQWRPKEDLARSERDSQAYWDELDDDRRAAMLLIVKEALMQLIEAPKDWVPTSIEPSNDHRLDVFISIHLAEVDDEVVRRKLEAERALHEATQGVITIESELRSLSE
jgi:hypothetical protein